MVARLNNPTFPKESLLSGGNAPYIPGMNKHSRFSVRKSLPRVLALAAVLALSLTPVPADARAGGGRSSGSRGSYTYSPPPPTRTAPSAAPMERSMTPQGTPGYTRPDYGQGQQAGARSGGMFGGGFGGMLMGGLLGAGLFGMLSGSGFFGGMGMGGLLGMLLQFFLIFWVVRKVAGFFRGRAQTQPAGSSYPEAPLERQGGSGFPPIRDIGGGGLSGRAPSQMAPVETAPLTLDKADFDAFEATLIDIQAAWSRSDTEALRRLTTGEMYGYFNEDLQAQASRGETNTVTNVALEQGDLSQAWRENGRDYATVAMKFSMLDVTRNTHTGQITDGSDTDRVTATELWTFTRLPLQAWQLSAIQQAA